MNANTVPQSASPIRKLNIKKSGRAPFPFSAIVGQDDMKTALILTAIDPSIGGVLVFGDRGTGKSTAVRALAALLPEIDAVDGCPVNSARPEQCPEWAKDWPGLSRNTLVRKPTPVIDLPLGASEDRVTGALDIERAIAKGEKSIERQRQVLATLQKFEPHSAFQRINRDQSGKISSMEILKFLRDNGVEEATEADTYYIVKYFDSNDDELLEYDDLLQMVMPCDDQYLRAAMA